MPPLAPDLQVPPPYTPCLPFSILSRFFNFAPLPPTVPPGHPILQFPFTPFDFPFIGFPFLSKLSAFPVSNWRHTNKSLNISDPFQHLFFFVQPSHQPLFAFSIWSEPCDLCSDLSSWRPRFPWLFNCRKPEFILLPAAFHNPPSFL